MTWLGRSVVAALLAGALAALTSSTAFAHECFNIDKNQHNPDAGVQVAFDEDDNIAFASDGVMKRVEHGLIDPDSGEGFHGLIGFVDEEGEIVASTFIVTPEGEIPVIAQDSGSSDHGIVNVCDAGLCGP
jgi:hypothetical protein